MTWGAVEARHPTRPDAFPTESPVELQRRAIAPMRQRAEEPIYRGGQGRLSTLEARKTAGTVGPGFPVFKRVFGYRKLPATEGLNAVLQPHSSAVLAPGMNAFGGSPAL
jgi:hypothetical protein